MVALVFGLLVLTLAGGYFSFKSAVDFSHQVGWQGTPPLVMTVDSCSGHGGGRAQAFSCLGHGDRGSADTVDGEWQLHDLPHGHSRGTVLKVSCSPGGDCVELGAHDVAGDVGMFLLGLWLVSWAPCLGAAMLIVRRGKRLGRPARKGLGPSGRLGLAWLSGLPVLALLAGLVSLFL